MRLNIKTKYHICKIEALTIQGHNSSTIQSFFDKDESKFIPKYLIFLKDYFKWRKTHGPEDIMLFYPLSVPKSKYIAGHLREIVQKELRLPAVNNFRIIYSGKKYILYKFENIEGITYSGATAIVT